MKKTIDVKALLAENVISGDNISPNDIALIVRNLGQFKGKFKIINCKSLILKDTVDSLLKSASVFFNLANPRSPVEENIDILFSETESFLDDIKDDIEILNDKIKNIISNSIELINRLKVYSELKNECPTLNLEEIEI